MRFGAIGTLRLVEAEPAEGLLERSLRERRVAAARRNNAWTELRAPLVRRGRYYVDPDDDRAYTRAPAGAAIFAPKSADLLADRSAYYFTLSDDGLGLAFYERLPWTWSKIVARNARRGTSA